VAGWLSHWHWSHLKMVALRCHWHRSPLRMVALRCRHRWLLDNVYFLNKIWITFRLITAGDPQILFVWNRTVSHEIINALFSFFFAIGIWITRSSHFSSFLSNRTFALFLRWIPMIKFKSWFFLITRVFLQSRFNFDLNHTSKIDDYESHFSFVQRQHYLIQTHRQ
jgi:hypothetical protein